MLNLKVAILFSTIFVVVSSAFLSDGVKKFNFQKAKNDSSEYDFDYELDNGKIFQGRTYKLNFPYLHVYMMLGADDTIYWVEFSTKDEILSDEPFSETVRLVERSEDKLTFRDDFNEHELSLSSGELKRAPYETDWDLENICFVKSNINSNAFEYVISSKNNSRKETSITKNETDDPHLQLVTLLDDLRYYGVYEVMFTDEELRSNGTFCKGISKIVKIIYYRIVQTPISTNEINGNLLKSLVG